MPPLPGPLPSLEPQDPALTVQSGKYTNMGILRIVSTAGDLAKAAASVPPTVPIILGVSEIEPGADVTDDAAWAVVAEDVMVPATEQGTIAGPGEPAAIVTELSAEGVTRRLAGVQVLLLRARLLAQPGQLGPDATPADAEIRRADAFQAPDGDMNRFLLELADAVSALREEIVEATQAEHQPLSPAAQRRLLHAVDALDGARLEIGDAVRFGDVCELARRGIVDDDQPCQESRQADVRVYLPDLHGGSDETGCLRHVAAVEHGIPGAHRL
ncbi:hypothetical protein [Nonomuraea sp. NPDC049695]|uniref:hypothetical protein n=1 Tax=Nonomuraea sp. NPDC049695 TaxID=3154734 RepID=UPI00341D7218